ncbi:carbohydrate binding domain-containing protein [Paenibacillus sp. J5C_2022]|uniref:carbohydrate binding domain-containing protein n=1 Tax=Paenibacillus sp. J5C2022 TaxID=2977129 RepID=UPI0021CE0CA0|nr:carbohydrate binding domain-containing protein [Paenibacillus sp. J5C2022]MCU6708818.1 carbohydrate binding domain-containing protein [Paenibacillus sp. J5C2022]
MKQQLVRTVFLLLLCFCLLMPMIPFPSFASDSSLDLLLVEEQAYNYGRGSSESENGGSIGWGEAYLFNGFANAYDATADNQWLDKMEEHADRVIASAQDLDGDGYKGWPDPSATHWLLKNNDFAVAGSKIGAEELVINGGFETDADNDGIPDGWTQQGNTSKSGRSVNNGDKLEGLAGAVVETDGAQQNRLVQTLQGLEGGKAYTVTFYAGVQNEKSNGRVEIYNANNHTVISEMLIHHVNYEMFVLQFTAPSSNQIQIRLGLAEYGTNGLNVHFDNISVREADLPPYDHILNLSFEEQDGHDSTLPQYWTRIEGSNTAAVRIAAGYNQSRIGERGLRIDSGAASFNGAAQSFWYKETESYTPSGKYVVNFYGRVDDPHNPGIVRIMSGGTSIAAFTFNNTKWALHRFAFTAPSITGQDLKAQLSHEQLDADRRSVYFDNVSIKAISQTDAAGWVRSVDTTSEQAYRTNDPDIADLTTWGYHLTHNGSHNPKISQRIYNYETNQLHGFSIRARLSPGTTGNMRIYDETADQVLASRTLTMDHHPQRLVFTAPNDANHVLQAEIYISDGTEGQWLTIFKDIEGISPKLDILHEDGLIGAMLLGFVQRVYDDPRLHESYKAKADQYLAFVASNLFRKWDSLWVQLSGTDGSNNGTGVYKLPSGNATEWYPSRSENHNHYNIYAQMLYKLYEATEGISAYAADRPFYRSRANDMLRIFKSKLRPNDILGSAYEWNYWDNLGPWDDGLYVNQWNDNESPDYPWGLDNLSHGAANLPAVLSAYRNGNVFDDADMAKFTATFTDVLWNQNLAFPILGYNINHNGGDHPYVNAQIARRSYLHHWTDLIEFDQQVWKIANAICQQDDCFYAPSNLFKWNRNKTINPGFELVGQHDSTLPKGWLRWNATASNVYLVSDGDAYIGNRSLAVKTNGKTSQGLEQPIIHYEPNTDYVVFYSGKTDGAVQGKVEIVDRTAGITLASDTFSHTSWRDRSIAFRTPAEDGHDIRIRLYQSNASPMNRVVYYDEVKVLPASFNTAIPNGSFETNDMYDDTLPRYWQRNAGNSSGQSGIDATSGAAGKQSLHLVSGTSSVSKLFYEWFGFRPGAVYDVRLKGKTNTSTDNGKIRISSLSVANIETEVATVEMSGTDWTDYAFSFTAPTNYKDRLIVSFELDGQPTSELWADDLVISLKPISIPNGSFETADPVDQTLPRYWLRNATNTSAEVGIDSTASTSGTNSIQLTSSTSPAIKMLYYKWNDYQTNASYNVSLKAKTDSAATKGRLQIVDVTTWAELANVELSGTSWNEYNFSFTAPSVDNRKVEIYIKLDDSQVPDHRLWVDDLNITLKPTVPNGSFELPDPTDSTLPRYWQRNGGNTSSEVGVDDTASTSGLQSLHLKSSSNPGNKLLYYTWNDFTPGAIYEAKLKGKTNAANTTGRMRVVDTTAWTELANVAMSGTNWTGHSFRFTAPADHTHQVEILLELDSSTVEGHELWIDELVISEIPTVVPNGSFEIQDPVDSTLPLHWQRNGGIAESGTIMADTTASTSGSRSVHLITSTSAAFKFLYYDWSGFNPGSTYYIKFKAKTNVDSNGEINTGRVIVADSTSYLASEAISGTDWREYALNFTAPATGGSSLQFRIQIDDTLDGSGQPIPGHELWVDEMIVTERSE